MDASFYRNLLECLYDGVYYVDRQKRIVYWNKAAEGLTGYSRQEVTGRSCADNLLRHVDSGGRQLCIEGCPLGQTLVDGRVREADVYLHHKQGHRVPVSIRVSPVRDADGRIVGAVEVFQESVSKMAMLEELQMLKRDALIDPLTRVGNRKMAEMSLQRRLEEKRRYGIGFGLLFFDIDHFKQCNDSCGHLVGDRVLCMVAQTAVGALRSVDVVARWGGEEFIVLLPNVDEPTLAAVAERLRFLIAKSWLSIDDRPVAVTVSVGATLAGDRDSPETLIERADQSLYVSKDAGRDRVTLRLPPQQRGD